MKSVVKDAKSKSRNRRRVLVKVSVCLLTSRPIPKRHLHVRAVRRGFRMYESTEMDNVIKI